MLYHSTRSRAVQADSAQAVLQGLSPDGGLYVPAAMPRLDVAACLAAPSAQAMAEQILTAFLPDIPYMAALVRRAYAGKFET